MLDGHNRYAICQKHGIQFKTLEMEFEDEDAACVWVIHNHFGRRNLQPFTRVELALKLEPLLRKKAKGKQSAGGGDKKSSKRKSVPKKSAEPLETRKELAAIAHVSHDTIAKGKIILERASEETKEALSNNDNDLPPKPKHDTIATTTRQTSHAPPPW